MDKSTEISLVDSIDKDSIKDIVVDHGEILLDEFINNETIKDIPILGSFANLLLAWPFPAG